MEDKVDFWYITAKRKKRKKITFVSLTKRHSNGIPQQHFEKSKGW